MALTIADLVVLDRCLAAFPRRDKRFGPFVFKYFTIPVGILTPVRQHVFRGRHAIRQSPRSDVVAPLASCQEHPQWLPHSIGDGMQLRVRPALGTAPLGTLLRNTRFYSRGCWV